MNIVRSLFTTRYILFCVLLKHVIVTFKKESQDYYVIGGFAMATTDGAIGDLRTAISNGAITLCAKWEILSGKMIFSLLFPLSKCKESSFLR